jgi:ABC-type Mn2+/Zn2+ transport system ATPase subunit
VITATHLSKSFSGHFLFKDISFSLGTGLFTIEGKSGCGKSTLMSILMGKMRPDSGQLSYGKDSFSFAYAGPESSLLGSFSYRENSHLLKRERDANAENQLAALLSFHQWDQKLLSLSGGERQKAEIIFALSEKAEAYFLDEPFASLDQDSKQALAGFLRGLSATKTVILINHDVEINPLPLTARIIFEEGNVRLVGNCQVRNSEALVQMKRQFSLRPWFANYFRTQKGYGLIKALLGSFAFLFFALGMSLTPTQTATERTLTLMDADPFSAHGVSLSDLLQPPSEDLMSNLRESGTPKLTIYPQRSALSLTFYGSLPRDCKQLYWYSNKEESQWTVSQNQTVQVANQSFNLVQTTQEEFQDHLLLLTQPAKSFMDNNVQDEWVACSPTFIDALLVAGTNALTFQRDSRKWDALPGLGLTNGLLSVSSSFAIQIVPDSGYVFRVGGIPAHQSLFDADARKYLTTDSLATGKSQLSLNAYQLLLLRSQSTSRPTLGYDCQDQIIRKLIETYGNGISPQNTLPDYAPKSGGHSLALSFGRLSVSRGFLHFLFPFWEKKRHPVSLLCLSESADSIFLLFLVCFLALTVGTAARIHLCASFLFPLVYSTDELSLDGFLL